MSDYHYTIVYGTQTDKHGKIVNPNYETIESANVLNYIKNIQFPYVDLLKTKLPLSGNQYNNVTQKIIYMHYKPECPFTSNSVDIILRTPRDLAIRLWNTNTNGSRSLSLLRKYLLQRGIKSTSFPQFFYKGVPLGGSDNLGQSLSRLFNIS